MRMRVLEDRNSMKGHVKSLRAVMRREALALGTEPFFFFSYYMHKLKPN